jgi:hypothetical protein
MGAPAGILPLRCAVRSGQRRTQRHHGRHCCYRRPAHRNWRADRAAMRAERAAVEQGPVRLLWTATARLTQTTLGRGLDARLHRPQ